MAKRAKINCKNCNKEVFKPVWAIKTGRKKFCGLNCYTAWRKKHLTPPSRKGYKFTDAERIEHSKRLPKGNKHWHWKHGVRTSNHNIRLSFEFKVWREKVFKRDNYTCQKCFVRGGMLHAHHPFAFIKCLEHKREDLITNVDNGITPCSGCHLKSKLHTGIV